MKPTPNLEQDFQNIKRQVVGAETKQIAFDQKIFDVDATKPRTFELIEDRRFKFFAQNSAQVFVHKTLFVFKWKRNANKVNVTKYENVTNRQKMAIV